MCACVCGRRIKLWDLETSLGNGTVYMYITWEGPIPNNAHLDMELLQYSREKPNKLPALQVIDQRGRLLQAAEEGRRQPLQQLEGARAAYYLGVAWKSSTEAILMQVNSHSD